MKKSLLIVFITVFVTPLSLLANTNNLFSANSPVQSYHQAGEQSTKMATTPSNNTQAMNKVKEIMHAARVEQEERATLSSSHPQTNSKPKASEPKAKQQTRVFNSRNQNPSAIYVPQKVTGQNPHLYGSASNTLLQRQMEEQIDNLRYKNIALQERVDKLREAVILLNQEVNQMTGQVKLALKSLENAKEMTTSHSQLQTSSNHNKLASQFLSFKHSLGHWFNYILYGLAGLIVVLFVFLIFARKKQTKVKNTNTGQIKQSESSSQNQESIEGDYDFMSSEEAIPAKLDLARSYLAMEDFASAQKVLQDILLMGSQEQREAAESMLNEMPFNQS